MSRSRHLEREVFEGVIDSLKNRRVPENPELISCGLQAKKIHQKLVKKARETIEDKIELTTRVVVGGFGSGKTHLIHWVVNDLWYHFGDNLLVSVVDLNLCNDFPEVIEQIFSRMTNKRNQSFPDILADSVQHLMSDIKLTSFERLKNRISEGAIMKEEFCGKLTELGFASEIADEIADYVTKSENNTILNFLPKNIRTFKIMCRLLLSKIYGGLCIFLDEFESLETKRNRTEIFDMFRSLHDEGGDFSSLFMLVLTRGVFWEQIKDICLPLYQRWNSTRRLSLGELISDDIKELFEKLLEIYGKAGYHTKHKASGEIDREVSEIYEGLSTLRFPRTFREVITVSIEKIEQNWVVS